MGDVAGPTGNGSRGRPVGWRTRCASSFADVGSAGAFLAENARRKLAGHGDYACPKQTGAPTGLGCHSTAGHDRHRHFGRSFLAGKERPATMARHSCRSCVCSAGAPEENWPRCKDGIGDGRRSGAHLDRTRRILCGHGTARCENLGTVAGQLAFRRRPGALRVAQNPRRESRRPGSEINGGMELPGGKHLPLRNAGTCLPFQLAPATCVDRIRARLVAWPHVVREKAWPNRGPPIRLDGNGSRRYLRDSPHRRLYVRAIDRDRWIPPRSRMIAGGCDKLHCTGSQLSLLNKSDYAKVRLARAPGVREAPKASLDRGPPPRTSCLSSQQKGASHVCTYS